MSPQEIEKLFKGFNNLKCLIIGDVMVDSYLWGNVSRISPEAPVPVFEIKNRENRLGGAANVALNIQALEAKPILCGVIGKDAKGFIFKELLEKRNLSTEGIVEVKDRVTTCKTRVISSSHHMLRIDEERLEDISESAQKSLFERVQSIIDNQEINVVIFEDYDKGVLSPSLINQIVELCNSKGIPTTVDPKKKNFNHYKNTSLFKPNFKEFTTGLKIDINSGDKIEEIAKHAIEFGKKNGIDKLMITLSEHGVLITEGENQFHVPAELRNISDVSGAGDTVIATASLALASSLQSDLLIKLSNLAGGLVCEEVGVVPINKDKLKTEFIAACR